MSEQQKKPSTSKKSEQAGCLAVTGEAIKATAQSRVTWEVVGGALLAGAGYALAFFAQSQTGRKR